MGGDFGSCFPPNQQSPNLNYLGASLHLGQHNTISTFMVPGTGSLSLNGTSLLESPHPPVVQGNERQGWFYCMPHFRQAFVPTLNSVLKQNLPDAPIISGKETVLPKVVSGCDQKRFLVFDQSGDQTTLIFSSGIGTPVTYWNPKHPKPTVACDVDQGYPETKQNVNVTSNPPLPADQLGENDGTNLHSEMHEDTEELNALLYSDSDEGSDYTEDDEVTSTGHSPSTMTAYDKQDWSRIPVKEEVASSDDFCIEKCKLFDMCFSNAPSITDTSSSLKRVRNDEYEDDAESSCNIGVDVAVGEMGAEQINKRMRIQRICETVSILQDIIPGGQGKDAIVVLDEAIQYFKSLKLKAKALGLDALHE